MDTQNKLRIFEDDYSPKAFQSIISYKEMGQTTESEDQLMIFSYNQFKDPKSNVLSSREHSNEILHEHDKSDESD